ncbi:efflux RND transporter periplasmic adaptor subunit [Actinoplanes aureus]|uniref:Biotin/lipoyl-binding protein n=1 Tax=Actinoplanes aureus TaxID=2792083 RepID=A0A931CCD0_9ACTN|nr:biotin/lipoyl-binding protein [Actinoplanes aureus]MBG0562300.1 biotin/lipoyl-binding protein [Actinoplanes aureus]
MKLLSLPSRHPSLVVNAVIGVALLAGAFTVYRTFAGSEDGTAAVASERTVTVQQGTVTRTATADGTLESASTASASFETSGTVTEIKVTVGDKVKKGQVLAKVDPAAANRDLGAAEADLDAARDALDRAEDAGSDTSDAENQVTEAELKVDEAEAAVDGTVLKAPMTGTVTAVNGTLGSSSGSSGSSGGSSQGGQEGTTGTSTGFVEIADLTRMQVAAAFAEADATSLKEKQAATVTWNALGGVQQSARVAAVDPSATTTNSVVTYGVTLTLDKVPTGAKVGQTVSVSVTTGSVPDVVLVNAAALTTVGNRHTVTVITNGVPETRSVEIGLEGDSATEIKSGLTVGEQVVVKTTSISGGSQQGGFPAGGGGFPGGGMPAGGGMPGGGRGGQ